MIWQTNRRCARVNTSAAKKKQTKGRKMWKLLSRRWISHRKLMFSIKHSAAVLNTSVNHMKRTMLWLIQRSGECRLLAQPHHFLLCRAAHWSDWLKTHQSTLKSRPHHPLLPPPKTLTTASENWLHWKFPFWCYFTLLLLCQRWQLSFSEEPNHKFY